MNKKALNQIKAWAGFLDGKMHFYNHSPSCANQPMIADVFRSRRRAQKEYDDVRRVTIIVEQKRGQ